MTKGEILFDGKVVNHLSPRQRNIALAFESYALYYRLSVFENIAFPLRAAGMPNHEVSRKVNEMAKWLELKDLLKRKPGNLSGGQQQRISLARALVRQPTALLLDEPLSHLDHTLRVSIRARIRRIHDELSTTTIYVTHNQEEAVTLAEKIIVMKEGQIEQIGTPEDLVKRPANEFVAGFIGEPAMNFIQGKGAKENSIAFTYGERPALWPIRKSVLGGYLEKNVLVGFRPDKVKIYGEEKPDGIKARIDVVEFLGEEKMATLSIADTTIKAICGLDRRIETNDCVWVCCDPDDIHVFDKNTGRALLNGK